ncbi:MAG: CDP-diacylglycerol--serine O-phosphatidyltransferase [Oligoflexia bacterium]|jgi:CDP-diacylglycerol--serine O-phosphatidyltransferase
MRKVYLVPNMVTSANLFCGFYSILSSARGDFTSAAWAIFVAAIFDSLDGRIARMAKATSAFGVEYDSLSDLTSFGLAPGVLLYQFALAPLGRVGIAISFLFALCSALRLARFNVSTSTVSKNFFQGLPTPAAANLVGTFIIFQAQMGMSELDRMRWLLAMAVGVSILMVSSVAFPSFKEFHWRSRGSVGILLIGMLSLVTILIDPEVSLFLVGAFYVVASLGWNVLRWLGVLKTPVAQETGAISQQQEVQK